jgi:hypothetical protein
MGPRSELEMGVLLDEPSPPVNFAASCAGILVCSAIGGNTLWLLNIRFVPLLLSSLFLQISAEGH